MLELLQGDRKKSHHSFPPPRDKKARASSRSPKKYLLKLTSAIGVGFVRSRCLFRCDMGGGVQTQKRRKANMFACGFAAVLSLAHSQLSRAADEVEVIFEAETSAIRAMDPLFVKITICNNGKKPLVSEREFSHEDQFTHYFSPAYSLRAWTRNGASWSPSLHRAKKSS